MPRRARDDARVFWRLRRDVTLRVETAADNGKSRLVLQRADVSLPFATCPSVVAQALAGLRTGCDEARLSEAAARTGGDAFAVARALHLFAALRRLAVLEEVLTTNGADYAVCEPMTSDATTATTPSIRSDGSLRLSRFAFVARHGDGAVLESPLSPWRIRLPDAQAAALVCRLMGAPVSMAAIDDAPGRWLARRLVACSFAGTVDDHGRLPEDADPDLRLWDFHDLLHARRSRTGGHDHPVGASFPGRGAIEPLPAVKPAMATRAEDLIDLPRIDIATACRTDPPHQAVIEARRSIRRHGARPITLEALGELLWRSARLIARVPPDPAVELFYEASRRPWPCGGAAYETEIYVTADRCEGLPRGIYHYDPERHRLERLSRDGRLVDTLVEIARHSAARTVRPQVLLTLTARMRRLSWKYRGMAWAVAQKHAGVLYHAFYLAATVTGVAPCGLGAGDTRAVARAIGVDPAVEMPIGEFMLGSLPERS